MAFNDLDLNQMVSLFSAYVNDAELKKQFLSIPELAGLFPRVVSAYQGVLSVRPTELVNDPETVALSTTQKGVDNRHDRLGRATLLFLQAQRERALAEDPPNEERASALTATIDTLFPDGGSIFLASYRAESGNTERVERLLESPEGAEAKAALKSIPVQKGETALDTVQLWISAGDELGKLENKKTARAAALQSAAPPAQRVVQQARSQWIKVAGLIVANAEVSDAPAATVSAVTHSLLSAAAGAGGRGARKGSPEQPPAPAEPASPADGSAAPPK